MVTTSWPSPDFNHPKSTVFSPSLENTQRNTSRVTIKKKVFVLTGPGIQWHKASDNYPYSISKGEIAHHIRSHSAAINSQIPSLSKSRRWQELSLEREKETRKKGRNQYSDLAASPPSTSSLPKNWTQVMCDLLRLLNEERKRWKEGVFVFLGLKTQPDLTVNGDKGT
jgi:hypothetical protein